MLMSDSFLKLAGSAYREGKLTDALNYLSSSLKYSKGNPDAFLLLAKIYNDQGNQLMARDYLGRTLLLNPGLVTDETTRQLGYALGITNQSDWKKFLNEIGVREWPKGVTY